MDAKPVELADLDLSLVALFAGYALTDAVRRRLHDQGWSDLRTAHGFVFQHLVDGPCSVGRIATAQQVTTQAVSQQLRELEDLGYVERFRDPDDRRVRLVALSDRGRAAVEAARVARRTVHDELADRLGHDRIEMTTNTLRAILEVLDATSAIASRRVQSPQ